jgi:hypothetical protein
MGLNIAKLVAKNLVKYGKPLGVQSCTLVKVASGALTPGQYSGAPAITETSYSCKGMLAQLTVADVQDASEVQANDRRVSLLGATISSGAVIPGVNDKVTLKDLDGTTKTFRLVTPIEGDGVGAVYSFIARL